MGLVTFSCGTSPSDSPKGVAAVRISCYSGGAGGYGARATYSVRGTFCAGSFTFRKIFLKRTNLLPPEALKIKGSHFTPIK